jgi:hypothetical protein
VRRKTEKRVKEEQGGAEWRGERKKGRGLSAIKKKSLQINIIFLQLNP